MILFSTINIKAQELLTKEQQEFVDIINIILNNKEVKQTLRKNNLINKNNIYILNRNTPLEGIIYSQQVKGGNAIVFTTSEELFFRAYNFIEIKKYTINQNQADLELIFDSTRRNFTLIKTKKWKIN